MSRFVTLQVVVSLELAKSTALQNRARTGVDKQTDPLPTCRLLYGLRLYRCKTQKATIWLESPEATVKLPQQRNYLVD